MTGTGDADGDGHGVAFRKHQRRAGSERRGCGSIECRGACGLGGLEQRKLRLVPIFGNGGQAVSVPAGLLAVGTDTLTANFTPANTASYASAADTTVTVLPSGAATPVVTASSVTYSTGGYGSPFRALLRCCDVTGWQVRVCGQRVWGGTGCNRGGEYRGCGSAVRLVRDRVGGDAGGTVISSVPRSNLASQLLEIS